MCCRTGLTGRCLTGGTGGRLEARSWKAQAGGAFAAAGLPAPVVSNSQSESESMYTLSDGSPRCRLSYGSANRAAGWRFRRPRCS